MTPVLFFSLSYLSVLSCPISFLKGQNNTQHLHKTFPDDFKQFVFAVVYI